MIAKRQRLVLRLVAVLVVFFGIMTIKVGGSVVLDLGAARAERGQYVPFVVWFNFLSGFAYVAAGAGLWLGRRWAAFVALALAVSLAVTAVAFAGYVFSGGAFERSTVVALALRLLLWVGVSVYACRVFGCRRRAPERVAGS